MKTSNSIVAVTAATLLWGAAAEGATAPTPSQVTGFGSNPGNLRMFKYIPQSLPTKAPLVVALHGCTQSASSYGEETGWVKFAGIGRFALLLPEQQESNNSKKCFNWFQAGHIRRDQGEVRSIKQMIDRMVKDHDINPKRIYVTGLSAGGGMTAVMLSTYPEIFDGGAIIAGLPYQCAVGVVGAFGCMNPGRNLSPAQWGTLVRHASSHKGPWPRVSIWHGTADTTVAPMNAAELVEQWTNVHGIDQIADEQNTVNGHAHQIFKDAAGRALVETYMISNMGHGTPIAPGSGEANCGTAAPFILDAGICSSFHIARFWGVLPSISTPPVSTEEREKLLLRIEDMQKNLDQLRLDVKKSLGQ